MFTWDAWLRWVIYSGKYTTKAWITYLQKSIDPILTFQMLVYFHLKRTRAWLLLAPRTYIWIVRGLSKKLRFDLSTLTRRLSGARHCVRKRGWSLHPPLVYDKSIEWKAACNVPKKQDKLIDDWSTDRGRLMYEYIWSAFADAQHRITFIRGSKDKK